MKSSFLCVAFLLFGEFWWGGWLSDIEENIVSNLNMAFAEVAFKHGGGSACEVMSQELCSHRLIHNILDINFSLHGIAPCEVF
jgi:hypothetical protein